MRSGSEFLPFLKELALGAGSILMRYYSKPHRIKHKHNAGIVTEADRFAEDHIIKKIYRKYPESSIIAEESGESRGDNSLCWILDPLDGTSNYAHGFPWFCVSLGLHVEGKAYAGVIFQPISGEMFYTQAKRGAFLNGSRIHVSRESRISDSLLGTGFYYSKGRELREEIKVFHKANEIARAVRRPGSAALDLAFVACGRYDGFWERGLSPWDVAAGFLLVEEAGGIITDYRGRPISVFDREVVATNGKIHKRLLSVTRTVSAAR